MWTPAKHVDHSYRQPTFNKSESSSPLADCFRKMSIYEAEDDERINAEHRIVMDQPSKQEPI